MYPLYKRLPLLILAALLPGTGSYGQNIPALSQTQPAGMADTITLPPAFTVPGGQLNYMRSYAPRVPISDPAQLTKYTPSSMAVAATTYRDGFNRDMETVQHNTPATGNGSLVVPADARFKRDGEAYLPYYSSSPYGFRANAFREQQDYYNGQYPGEGGVSYSRSLNSSTAASRSATSLLPGRSQAGQNRGSTLTRIANDAYTGTALPTTVRIWALDGNDNPVSPGWYPANQLFGELGQQSGGGTFYTFTDKDGRLVSKVQLLENTGTPVYGTTYYVYDDMGKLRHILPPKATAYATAGMVDNEVLSNLCFQYRYDDKGRPVASRDPGEEGFTETVYDPLDRPVLRRTPLEAQRRQWEVTFLSRQGRIKATGLLEDNSSSCQAMQQVLDNTASSSPADLSYYLCSDAGMADYPAEGAVSNLTMMSYSWYDTYAQSDPNSTLYNNMQSSLAFSEQQSSPGAETPQRGPLSYGLLTSSKVRILPSPNADPAITGDWKESIVYYDAKGRAIAGLSRDLYQGATIHYDYTASQYNFSGQLLVTKHITGNTLAQGGTTEHTEVLQNEYEANTGRLWRSSHKVDGGPWKVLASYSYDALGRVARKSIGNGGEVQDMSYNIRGQLTGINGLYAETGNKQGLSKTFGESLKYDYGFSQPRYDGKIAGMVWRGAGSNVQPNAYGYSYDLAGRLTAADYRRLESASPALWSKAFADYTVSNITYDVNGNLKTMDQRGVKPGSGPYNMDKLQYSYEAGDKSNRLQKVVDNATEYYEAGDFLNTNGNNNDYAYDAAGNLALDNNKNIAAVTYTHFNKPSVIVFGNHDRIEYSYDASGSKVQELVTEGGNVKRTDYLGNAVYQDDMLQYLLTGEGRTVIDPAASTPVSEEFFVKDHLGNVRSTIDVVSYPMLEYLATYEVASANVEGLVFDHMDEVRDNNPVSTNPYDLKSGNLNGADPERRIGSSLLVKVMAGDQVALTVNSFYEGYNAEDDQPVSPEDMLVSVITTLTNGRGAITGESHNTKLVEDMFNEGNFDRFDDLLNRNTDPARPKAYLNYLLFDEQMQLVGSMSGVYQAEGNGSWAAIGSTVPMEIPENGYLAVYLSNATQSANCLSCGNVYFDQLNIQLTKGNLKEENHYYPFGLPIATLSSRADGFKEQRRKYQGNEYIKDLGLHWMDFHARQYDPQLGRFLGVDPLASSGGQDIYSPYAAMGNAPESMVDPNGEAFETAGGAKFKAMFNFGKDFPRPLAEGGNSFGQVALFGKDSWVAEEQEAMTTADMINWVLTTGGSYEDGAFKAPTSQGNSTAASNNMSTESGNSATNSSDPKAGGQATNGTWTLSFTGKAEDRTHGTTTRQIGIGQLAIIDAEGNVIAVYDAISGAGINGLLPNGEYKGTNLSVSDIKKAWRDKHFPDETGLEYTINLAPVGKLANGFKRSGLLIHPTAKTQGISMAGQPKQYNIVETDGCIGLVGNQNAAPFLKYMQTYFQTHSSINVTVNIDGNANINIQIRNKSHY